jgi:hypothetical protein
MSFEALRTGTVIYYSFLWKREAERGETEGRKPRPVAVGVRIPEKDGNDLLILFPITSQPPETQRFAAEIPDIEKRRAGLESDKQLWIILDEFNEDVIGQSLYIEPTPPLGAFSKAYFLPLLKEFIKRRSKARGVSRRG